MDAMAAELLALMERLSRAGLRQAGQAFPRGEAFLLRTIMSGGGVTGPAELSRVTRLSTARVAAALNSMARKGWIVREADGEDRRRTRVRLTPQGEAFAAEQYGQALSGMRALLCALGEPDASDFLRILRRIEAFSAPDGNIERNELL